MKIFFGMGLILIMFLGYRKVINPYYTLSIPKFVVDTSKSRPAQEDIIAIKSQLLTSDEKISSSNKRLDDLLVFGGIILTLILAINIGVYVNAEKSVNKHMAENFELHKNKIEKYVQDVEQAVAKAKTELELVEKMRKQAQSIQTPE